MNPLLLKALRGVVYGLLFLTGLALSGVLVLIGTEAGASWVIRTALDGVQDNSTVRVSVGDIDGTLLGELELNQVTVRDTANELRINAESVALSANILALFNNTLHIHSISATGFALTLPAASDEPADPVALLDTLFSLPLAVRVDALSVAPFTLAGEQDQTLQSIEGALQLDSGGAHVTARITRDSNTVIAPDITLAAGSHAVTGAIPWRTLAGGQAAAGELTLAGDIFALEITHALTAPVALASEGSLVTGLRAGDAFSFNFTHRGSNLQGASFNVPALENITGTVTTAGTPEHIDLTVQASAGVPRLGAVSANLAAVYADDELAIRTLRLDNERFSLSGAGAASFVGGPSLRLEWMLADFNDGDLWPQLDLSDVNGNGSVIITPGANDTVTELGLATLTGNLNGYPLTGNGDIAMTGGAVRNVALTLVSDVNSLLLEGSVSPQLDLEWQLQAPALTQLLEGLSGEITGSGSLTGAPAAPQVAGRLNAAGVAWESGATGFSVGALDVNASYDGGNADANALTLAFSDLRANVSGSDLVQDTGLLELTGTRGDHAISLSTDGPGLALQLEGEGGFDGQQWRGLLATVGIESPYGDWALQDSLQLAWSQGRAEFGNHCWLMQEILACGEAGWTDAAGLAGNLAVDNIPLAWLNDNLPEDVPNTQAIRDQLGARPSGLVDLMQVYEVAMPDNGLIEGMLDVTAVFTGLGADWNRATLSAILAPRDLSLGIVRPSPVDADSAIVDVERYGIDEVDITVDRMNGRWQIRNRFEIYLAEGGGLDFQGLFNGNFLLDDDETLGGDFELTFNNIAWVEALVPSVTRVSGELGANGTLGGDLQRPLLNMTASLDNGGFALPDYGLDLENVNLDVRSSGNNEITATGTASSGEGNITLDSLLTMPLLESRTLRVEVRGENFELVNLPDTRMVVAPDLLLEYQGQVLNVSGSLDVPQMHIDLSDRPAQAGNAVEISRDVVIVSGDRRQPVNSNELLDRIPVAGEVRLGMGEDVTFRGYGLDLELTGNLMLEQSVDRPLLAHGELAIPMGSYELYGQRLTITDGKLLFLGNPLNPALDIRAVRETRVAEVGLYMNGTVRRINAQLFSTPALPESEILSLLVTGNTFGSAGGQSGENMLGAIALLGLEKGQGLTSTVTNKLGIDTVAIESGSDYRDSALGLGKYIGPNLFMRYDIGLFDRENKLTLDYILTDRLRLEVESGVSQSVDLTYTVEK